MTGMNPRPNCHTLNPGVCALPSASVVLKYTFSVWLSSASTRSRNALSTTAAQLDESCRSSTVLTVNKKSPESSS